MRRAFFLEFYGMSVCFPVKLKEIMQSRYRVFLGRSSTIFLY